jgi:hypothetical protein
VVNAPGVEVAVMVMQTNRQYYLNIVFPAGFEARTNQNLALTVKTDNPHYPAITVPVMPVPGMALPARPAVRIPPARTNLLSSSVRVRTAAQAAATNVPPSPPNPAGRANTQP